jgi:hypothetical protein
MYLVTLNPIGFLRNPLAQDGFLSNLVDRSILRIPTAGVVCAPNNRDASPTCTTAGVVCALNNRDAPSTCTTAGVEQQRCFPNLHYCRCGVCTEQQRCSPNLQYCKCGVCTEHQRCSPNLHYYTPSTATLEQMTWNLNKIPYISVQIQTIL